MQPKPTDEQLALAFRHLARPGWPTLLADALAHRIYGPAVRGLARNFGRRGMGGPAPAHTLPRPPAPPTQAEPRSQCSRSPFSKATGPTTALGAWPEHPSKRRTATTAGRFDPKKAAANDMDEQAA